MSRQIEDSIEFKTQLDPNSLEQKTFKKLADLEIVDRSAASQLITALPASDLVKQFNEIVVDRLVESGVDASVASRFADRVAWNTPRYVNEMVAEHAEKIKVLAEVYRNGGKEVLAYYASINEYLRDRIHPLPSEQVFDEKDLQIGEIYVPLEIQPLDINGRETSEPAESIEAWAIDKLLDSDLQAILFIQGEMLATSNDWQPLRLFERLNHFWEDWCEGEFIDRTEDNLPQKKMKILKEQMPERETKLGIRQVDV